MSAPVPPTSTLDRAGRFTARHARAVVAAWVLAAALAVGTALGAFDGGSLFDKLTSGSDNVPGESLVGSRLIEERSTSGPQVQLILEDVDPASPQVQRAVEAVTAQAAAVPGVLRAVSPYAVPGGPSSPEGAALVSSDGRSVLVSVVLRKGLAPEQEEVALGAVTQALVGAADDLPGATARTGGVSALVEAIVDQVEVDLRTGEVYALLISLLVMVVVFGGFVAAGLPLAGALASIAGALASLYAFAAVIDLDSTVVNVVTVLGLGLSIDYGLLVVSRFREELTETTGPSSSRADVEAAIGRTVARAGRTVLFSALIVAISLCGLLFFQTTVLRAIGAAAVSVVVVALAVALTLVPALVALAGTRLVRPGLLARAPGFRGVMRRLGDVPPPVGVFSRLAQWVQRRPWLVVVGVLSVLVVTALPALSMQLRSSGADLLPRGAEQRSFFEDLDARFPAAAGPDVLVVARGTVEQVRDYATSVQDLPGVASVDPPAAVGELQTLGVRVDGGDPAGTVAKDVATALRAERPDFPTYVTGRAAETLDFTEGIVQRAPVAIGVVVLATFALLFVMTGSLLVPLKALLLNVVSLGASLGVVVLIFQQGNLENLLGFTSTGGIETTIPPLALAFGFGLSMDYEVFLLARIKEQHDRGVGNDRAVVEGLQRSGRIITCAALLIIIVFSGFAAGQLLIVKQTGVALVVAVLIDATLVRMLLVPATMTLLGDLNWWAPAPLRRLHDRIGVSH
ncbi:MAG TPA: MMPL family transporter [Actinomycetales bacterium]